MQNRKPIVITLLTLLVAVVSVAQNSTDSPYSRYGYGMLNSASFGAARAMGSTNIGMRNNDRINHSNPASYSVNDSTTFLFDFGVSGQISYLTEGASKEKKYNGNLDHVAIQFPIAKGIGGSFGIMPYSQVGYSFGNVSTINGISGTTNYYGEGGLSEAYGGISIRPFKQLSIGANLNYLFGNISHYIATSEANSTFSTLSSTHSINYRALKPDFGIQWEQRYDKNSSFTLGVIYTPKIKLNTKDFQYTSNGSKIDTLKRSENYELAETFGAGLGWQINDRWTIASDVLLQKWSDVQFNSKKDSLFNRLRLSAGAEYIPNINGRHYYERIRYRFGGYYSNNYLNVKGSHTNEYGASFGVGLPFKSSKSILNLSVNYGQITPEYNQYITERYLKFTINIIFNEFWFFKRKIE